MICNTVYVLERRGVVSRIAALGLFVLFMCKDTPAEFKTFSREAEILKMEGFVNIR